MPGVKKDFVWDGPCNKREMALIGAPRTNSIKLLIYKEKRRFSASSSYMAEHIGQYTDFYHKSYANLSKISFSHFSI